MLPETVNIKEFSGKNETYIVKPSFWIQSKKMKANYGNTVVRGFVEVRRFAGSRFAGSQVRGSRFAGSRFAGSFSS